MELHSYIGLTLGEAQKLAALRGQEIYVREEDYERFPSKQASLDRTLVSVIIVDGQIVRLVGVG